MEKKTRALKILSITRKVFVWLVIVTAIIMMITMLFSVTLFNKNERSLFGYKFFIVRSDSMKATHFDAGDLVIAKEQKDYSNLKDGDIITFISKNPDDSFNKVVTHKIRNKTTDADGYPGYTTYGTTKDENDKAVVTYENILGVYSTHVPNIGSFFSFVKTTPGYLTCVLLPFAILILLQAASTIRLFVHYRAEQIAEVSTEREQLDKEREENRKMMEELLALKAKIAANETAAEGAPSSAEETPAEGEAEAENASEENISKE